MSNTSPTATSSGSTGNLPTPESRHRGELAGGVPLAIAGQTWHLPRAESSRLFDAARDKLFDHQSLTGQVLVSDLLESAYLLLWLAYDLAPDEIAGLLAEADTKALADAVIASLFGAESPHRTYTAWLRSALYANGIDPGQVPADLIPFILRHLVYSGRAEPASSYIDAVEAGRKRRRFAAMAQAHAAPAPNPPKAP